MPPKADFRRSLEAAWGVLDAETQGGLVERAKRMIEDALNADKELLVKGVAIACKDCGQARLYDIPVAAPDILTRAKVLEILANQTYGKPAEKREVAVSVGIKTLAELDALSMEELAELAGAEEAVWVELPPAAA